MSTNESEMTAHERASRAMAPLLNPEPHPFQVEWSDAHSMSTETLHGRIEAEIVAAKSQGYREGVEASAKVVEDRGRYTDGRIHPNNELDAAAIRSLLTKDAAQGEPAMS